MFFLNSLTTAAADFAKHHPFILDIVFLVNPSSFVWESVVHQSHSWIC